MRLFKGTCEAIRAMHDYRAPVTTSNSDPFSDRRNQSTSRSGPSGSGNTRAQTSGSHSDDEDDELFPHPEGDAEGGYSYHGAGAGRSAVPLMTKLRPEDEGETIYDGDEELKRIEREHERNEAHKGETESVPYAHRDLKPG